MAYLDDVLYNDRVRRVNKTITWAASITDQITVVGPTNRLIITCKGTNTGGTTLEPSGGYPNAFQRILVNTNRRGTIWDISGIEAELISSTFYNAERKNEVAAATAETGVNWVLPLSLDPGEMATITITTGALADIGAAITAWTGAVIRATVVIRQPKTYWGFRAQVLGAAGVVGASTAFTQPQIPIIPGFALCGVGLNIALTSATTIVTAALFPETATFLMSHGDDYLIDADVAAIRALMTARAGAGGYLAAGTSPVNYGIPWHMVMSRFTPVANNDSTQFTYRNCATASIDAQISKVCYVYVTGMITDDQAIPAPATKNVGGEVALQNPARVLSPSQAIGASVIPAGTQGGGTSVFNLRGRRGP